MLKVLRTILCNGLYYLEHLANDVSEDFIRDFKVNYHASFILASDQL